MFELDPTKFDQPQVNVRSKIIQYGLEELVKHHAFKEPKTLKEIAALCNDDLHKRSDGKEYTEISSMNVSLYLARIRKEASGELKEITKSGEVGEVLEELKAMTIMVKDKFYAEFEKDNTGKKGSTDFIRLHNALHEDIKLIANLQGKLRSYITVDTLTDNVMRIVKVVEEDPELNNRDKRRLIYKIKDVLTMEAVDSVIPTHNEQTGPIDTALFECGQKDCDKPKVMND